MKEVLNHKNPVKLQTPNQWIEQNGCKDVLSRI